MNDRQLEELLQTAWQPEPPEGMREKVLANAHSRLPRRSPFLSIGWKPALAAVGVVIVILTSISDAQRDKRLAAMMGEPSTSAHTRIARGHYYDDWQRRQTEIIAQLNADTEGRKRL